MTPRERFYNALNFKETDRPPHFEMKFELLEEAFKEAFPTAEEVRNSNSKEKYRLFEKSAELYRKTIEYFKWDAVPVWAPVENGPGLYEFIPFLKEYLGNNIPVGSFVWESIICIDTIKDYMQFAIDLAEEPEKLHKRAEEMLDYGIRRSSKLIDAGCDFIIAAHDLAFNAGPFMSPDNFREFTAPYLKRLIEYIRKQGATVIMHTDGNLMPIMDQLIEMSPHALQSIDPMAGMDIAEIKKLTFGKIALMGNVQCSLLQDGPDEEIVKSAKYCLDHGAKGGGFIFSSSNTIFKGLPLENYETMLNYFWDRYGVK
jgi:uroporphyrinogen decarboxylase